MHPVIAPYYPQLRELCARYHVARLALFGSAARVKEISPRSDLDFLVDYLPETGGDALDEFMGFKTALETLFERQVDLVERRAIRNRFFQAEVEATQVPVYEK